MKKLECYIRQDDVQTLIDALSRMGVSGLTVYPIQGFGKQRGKGTGSLLSRTKVEIFTLDLETDSVLAKILEVTRKGRFGDGKIAILPVDNVIRIRTGEKGAKAVF